MSGTRDHFHFSGLTKETRLAIPPWLHAVLMVMLEAWSARRDAQVRFLRAQVEMLQARLPGNRVVVAPDERRRLLRLGEEVGHKVKDIVLIVGYKTYRRWILEQARGKAPRSVGRPRLLPEVRSLIVRLATENFSWGVDRVLGELRKLQVAVGRSSVRRAMIDEGLHPDPARRRGKPADEVPWRRFLEVHMNTLVACDFFSKAIVTPLGQKMAYCLIFMHLGSRRVFVSPATTEPKQQWVVQQAKNVSMWLGEQGVTPRLLLHDRDTKLTEAFDRVFASEKMRVIKTPGDAPNANAYVESWIGKLKAECLDHFWCFSLKHLDHVTQAYCTYHNHHRPHQSLGNVPLPLKGHPPPARALTEKVRRRSSLGGLLKYYYRAAA
jgi:putative transposase